MGDILTRMMGSNAVRKQIWNIWGGAEWDTGHRWRPTSLNQVNILYLEQSKRIVVQDENARVGDMRERYNKFPRYNNMTRPEQQAVGNGAVK